VLVPQRAVEEEYRNRATGQLLHAANRAANPPRVYFSPSSFRRVVTGPPQTTTAWIYKAAATALQWAKA